MIKRDQVKYSRFYAQLEDLEIKLREVGDLGIHLKAADPELLKKLDDASAAIHEYFNKEEESNLSDKKS